MNAPEEIIKTAALKEFDLVGISPAEMPLTIEAYSQWIKDGHHGEMKYLERHLEKKRNPQLLLDGAKSWISMASHYDTAEPLSTELPLEAEKKGWVSRYARGGDYHYWIEEKHQKVISELQKIYPEEKFLSCVDSKAVLERDVARQAGLGWVGKNTCLINGKLGSYIFLSEILTTLSLQPDKAVMDHCGTCNKCLEACPTGAITAPRKLDATLCISYWTIESKNPAPEALSKKFGAQVFGCDICQDVCPWNKKSRRQIPLDPAPANSLSVFDLRSFVQQSPEVVKELIKDSALERAGAARLLENVAVALKNQS